MARTHIFQTAAGRSLLGLAALAWFAGTARGQYDPDWASHFRIGAMVGLNIKADFKLGSDISIHHPDGVYDDGYVRVDSTGNDGGVTTFWGYQNASQLSGQTLTMHDTTSFTPNANQDVSVSKDGGPFPGFDLAYGGNLWYWGRVRIGWDFGFGLLPINISGKQSVSGNVAQTSFPFGTGGIQVPGAPYNGPFQAPPPGNNNFPPVLDGSPGPTINSTNQGSISGSQTLDVILYTFRLGPSFYLDFNQYLGLSLGAGPALGLVSGNLKFDETVTVNGTPTTSGSSTRSKGQVDGTDVVYGGYVNATLMYHVVRNGDVYLGVQYMPMGNATISGGGHQAKLELGGQMYISAGINWPF